MRGPVAGAVDDADDPAGVGRRDDQRVIAPGAVVGDIDPLLEQAPVATSVPSASRMASSKNSRGCRFQTFSRVRSKTSWRVSTSSGEKRRQKSPAVVGSGMRSAPSASRDTTSFRRSSISSRQVPLHRAL